MEVTLWRAISPFLSTHWPFFAITSIHCWLWEGILSNEENALLLDLQSEHLLNFELPIYTIFFNENKLNRQKQSVKDIRQILKQLFSTDLSQLRQSRTSYMDGTFRSCPRPYGQLFSILGKYLGFVMPLVLVLMENRTIGYYRQVLQAVKAAVRRVTHHRWRPQNVITDFEVGLKTALETELPAATRKHDGCYFHFTQALWIESRVNQKLNAEVPTDWVRHFKVAQSTPHPFIVNQPGRGDFYDFSAFLAPLFPASCPVPTRPLKKDSFSL